MQESVLTDLLNAIDILALERLIDGTFTLNGTVPDWFERLYPDAALSGEPVELGKLSPFLENFLVDAEAFWTSPERGQLGSGPWIESDESGNTYELEATAVSMENNKVLLIELCHFSYQEIQHIIQKGRELHVDYDRLQKMKRRLIEAQDDLEKRIAERTADLLRAKTHLELEIEKREKSQEALRQNEQFLKDIFDAIQDGIVILDKNLNILRVNKWQEKMYADAKVRLGEKCYFVFHKRHTPCPSCLSQVTLETGSFQVQVVPEPSAEDPARWIERSFFPLTNADGEVVGVIECSKDISERRRAEEHVSQMQTQLVRAQKMEAIGTLAGGIAHDFNNILSAVIGFSELALAKTPDGKPPWAELQSILKAGFRARDLVKQILAISYRTEEKRQATHLDLIAGEVLKFLRAVLPTTIEIREEIPADVRPIWADPTQMHQVLMNLCTNAAHAMNEDGGVLEVRMANVDSSSELPGEFEGLRPGRYVKLTVSDSGMGIRPEIMEKIFDPYFTTKEKEKGTGLGLAVAKGVIASHGGRIQVASAPGRGSTFTVALPAMEVGATLDAMESKSILTGKERVLFVDDEQDITKYVEESLGRLGYRVVARTDSVEALSLFRSEPEEFDVVISDVTMPNMPGDEMVKQLLAIRPDMPIILCTGFSDRITDETAKTMGVSAFLMKPLTLHVLAETVRKALNANRVGRH
jgi:two-component system, cell cycle sensor histidine kinase and response regulator CckA